MSASKRVIEIAQETIKAAGNDLRSAIAALEDGSYLSDAGYTDADQTDIECAHQYLKEMDAGCEQKRIKFMFDKFTGKTMYRGDNGTYPTPDVMAHSSYIDLGGRTFDLDDLGDLPAGDTRTVFDCGDARRARRFAVQL